VNAAHWLGLLLAAAMTWVLVVAFKRATGIRGARFFHQPRAGIALGWLLFLAVAAVAAPLLAPYRPSQQLDITTMVNLPPSLLHPLGTDLYSRDIWSRILYGARVSLGVGTLAMLVAVLAGGLVGVTAGYFRRGIDAILMRGVDVGLAVPRIFIVLILIALWEHLALGAFILVLGLTGWFATSRMVRAEVLVVRQAAYVESARALGAGTWRILFRHVLPNAASPLIVSAALGVGNVILLEAALSFLGVGVQPPTPSWGNMIADGRDQLATAPWTTLAPGSAIALAVMALNATGDGFQRALDPRSALRPNSRTGTRNSLLQTVRNRRTAVRGR
jgi:peptide/nickel transport system permease protein